MHIDVAVSTLFDLLTNPRILFLMVIAVPMGVFFGSTPGLGGKLGLVLLCDNELLLQLLRKARQMLALGRVKLFEQFAKLLLKDLEPSCLRRLTTQRIHAGLDLGDDVEEPRKVRFSRFEPCFGSTLASTEF